MNSLVTLPFSATADHARSGLSDRYGFIPTRDIVSAFADNDWVVTGATEAKCRKEANRGFQKHLIRFAHKSQLELGRTDRIETVLINSHDGNSSVQVGAGVFRAICLNGMVVADSTVATLRLGHHRLSLDTVLNSAHTILGQASQVSDVIDCWKNTPISREDALHLAEQGIVLRWGTSDLADAPITATSLLQPRRNEDAGRDLWTTFNVVQEGLVRGGGQDASRRRNPRSSLNRMFGAVRSVKGLAESVRINSGLWQIASTFAK